MSTTRKRINFSDVERDFIRKKILPTFEWVHFEKPSPINENPKQLKESRIAIVTTAGVHVHDDAPFNVRSRTGDSSYREIPAESPMGRLCLSHPGYDTMRAIKDINCVFPLERLRELAADGIIGSQNHRHFSFMGYIPIPDQLLNETGPEVARKLVDDGVNLVLLAPT